MVAATVAILEAFALMLLTPLKTVEPYTLMVDRTTGYVQALSPLNPERVTPDQALTQSMLAQYVIARETFDITTIQTEYRKVGLWSANEARSDYVAEMQATNPGSPLARFPRSTIVETRVKSVSPLTTQSALVRFETRRRDAGGAPHSILPWVAVVQYRFVGEPMAVEDRFLNPLGFQVTSYRRDAEAPMAAEPPLAQSIAQEPIDAEAVEVQIP